MSVKVKSVEYITAEEETFLDVTIKVWFSSDTHARSDLDKACNEFIEIPWIVTTDHYQTYLNESAEEDALDSDYLSDEYFTDVLDADGEKTCFVSWNPPKSAYSKLLESRIDKKNYVMVNCDTWLNYDADEDVYIFRDYITKTPCVLGALKELEDIKEGVPCVNYRFELDGYVITLLQLLHWMWD